MLQHGWTLRTFSSVQFSSVAQSCPSSQGYGFSCGHVWMWELDCEESWAGAVELWCWRLESPLDCKEIQPVHSKGGQPWDFFERNDAKAETPVLWPPCAKSWLIGKDSDAGMDWGQEEKGMTEDEMAGWHHRFDGHEFEWTPRVGDGQGGLARCDSRDCNFILHEIGQSQKDKHSMVPLIWGIQNSQIQRIQRMEVPKGKWNRSLLSSGYRVSVLQDEIF